jgi:two-component system sensor histidine kinase KdpD
MRSRRGWKRWLLGSVVDTVIGEAHNVNVYLLGSPRGAEGSEAEVFQKAPPPGLTDQAEKGRKERYRGYGWAVAVTLLCTLIARSMFGRFDLANLIMVYLMGVIFVATRFGHGPSILASVLGVAAFDLLFVTPYYSFSCRSRRKRHPCRWKRNVSGIPCSVRFPMICARLSPPSSVPPAPWPRATRR